MTESAPDWRPAAALATLRLRAGLLERIRTFFREREVLEVETPILSVAGIPDPHIESFATRYDGPGSPGPRFLHTSPEFPMKRLLAADSGPIYQFARVFRQGEAGPRHNPEFTLLEWYRPGWDHRRLMDEVEALVAGLPGLPSGPAVRMTYGEAFQRYVGIDPHRSEGHELRRKADELGLPIPAGLGLEERDAWLDLLLTHRVEPELAGMGLVFIHDYPASQAALARIREEESGVAVAERFELYVDGVELANGFHELTDAAEQRRRFVAEAERRRTAELTAVPIDERLLAALEQGLPPSAGVAVGFDRLVMLAAKADAVAEVMAFPFDRA